jgi:tRNA-specific 2-thiouridylase
VLFPLGELTKDEVRELARQRGLPVAEQPESQDICFVADGDYRRFLARCAPHLFRPGPICDVSGYVLGQHEGLPSYTIGQRKGLGIAATEPLYVLAIDTAENTLVVGPADELGRDECLLQSVHYVDRKVPPSPFQAMAQIRYRSQAASARVTPLPYRGGHVRFASVQRDITPGQFLVLYQGEVVLGGGMICKTLRPVL